tara:strand:+ start:1914 stop:3167 length:1254 start_codon:yes stop_codon:yes gene_type:complete
MLALLATAPAQSAPLRLSVNGSQLLDPTSKPIRLVGFNWQVGRTGPDPGALQKKLAPQSNLARLVGIQWGNTHPLQHHPNKECLTNTPPNYFNEKCFEDLDPWVKSATDAGLWVVLAVRGEYIAGQLYDSDPGTVVFRNSTLQTMLFAMWKHVAAHYASFDRIAAYEILSEPRDKSVAASAVRAVYEGGCAAVQQADPRTPCLVGGAPYYKLWTFGEQTLINNSNVIYTFDYFNPDAFVFGRDGTTAATVEESSSAAVAAAAAASDNPRYASSALAPPIAQYNASYPCSTLYDGWVSAACPSWNVSSDDAPIMFDRSWHEHNLRYFADALKTAHDVPVFLNQFEVVHGVTEAAGRYAYIRDLLSIAQQLGIGWAWWTWEGGSSGGWSHGSSEVVFRWDNGSTMVDTAVLDAMRPYWA